MMTGKQMGLWFCFLFWALFALARLWQGRSHWRGVAVRLGMVAVGLSLGAGIVCASPYYGMWRAYGHPLYPTATVDEARHPVVDMIGDFDLCNADAAAMGHWGSFVNAFLSPTLAQWYYRWRLGQDRFAPNRPVWAVMGDDGYASVTPIRPRTRWMFLALVAVALAFGRMPERWVTAMVVVGLLAIPTAMIGYVRYTSWMWFVAPLAVCVVGRWSLARPSWIRRCLLGGTTIALAPAILRCALGLTAQADSAYRAYALLRACPPSVIYAYDSMTSDEDVEVVRQRAAHMNAGDWAQTALCNLRLLCRQEPRLRQAEVRCLDGYGSALERWPLFPGGVFRVVPDALAGHEGVFERNARNPDRVRRLARYPALLCQVWFRRVPCLIAWRLEELAGVARAETVATIATPAAEAPCVSR